MGVTDVTEVIDAPDEPGVTDEPGTYPLHTSVFIIRSYMGYYIRCNRRNRRNRRNRLNNGRK